MEDIEARCDGELERGGRREREREREKRGKEREEGKYYLSKKVYLYYIVMNTCKFER